MSRIRSPLTEVFSPQFFATSVSVSLRKGWMVSPTRMGNVLSSPPVPWPITLGSVSLRPSLTRMSTDLSSMAGGRFAELLCTPSCGLNLRLMRSSFGVAPRANAEEAVRNARSQSVFRMARIVLPLECGALAPPFKAAASRRTPKAPRYDPSSEGGCNEEHRDRRFTRSSSRRLQQHEHVHHRLRC